MGCSNPTAAASVTTAEPALYGYFVLSALKSGDKVSARWTGPSSAAVAAGTWTSAAGSFCFGSLALTPPTVAAGLWSFELSVNSSVVGRNLVTITTACNSVEKITILSPTTNRVVVGNGKDALLMRLKVTPARIATVSMNASYGGFGNVTTGTDGTVDTYYTAGSMTAGSTGTNTSTFSAKACGTAVTVSAPIHVYNYNGYNVHRSRLEPAAFRNGDGMTAAAIQAVFTRRGSFLRSFIFTSSGGFVDSNGNGKYDKGESAYGSVPVGATGTSAANLFASTAKGFNINPVLLLATVQKEKGLLSASTMPSKSTLDWAFGCTPTSDFKSQMECSARTFAKWFYGAPSTYPFLMGSIGHNPGTGTVTVEVPVETASTYSQYRYTPWIQDQSNGGGVYLFEAIVAGLI